MQPTFSRPKPSKTKKISPSKKKKKKRFTPVNDPQIPSLNLPLSVTKTFEGRDYTTIKNTPSLRKSRKRPRSKKRNSRSI